MKTIAVIGTGIMGKGIALNFLKKKYPVLVWNRSKEKIKHLCSLGAIEASTPKEAVSKADIVFEVTANDESSRFVWKDKNGILAGAKKESILITSSTLSISWVDELATLCKSSGITFFDMPLTGGRAGAESGKLILLVGGNKEELQKIQPHLEAISEKVLYFGLEGSGMRYKLVLNALQALHIISFRGVLQIAQKSGLDLQAVGDALSERPGGTTTALAWRDYLQKPKPINFSVEWIHKDLDYAKNLSDSLETPLLDNAQKQYKNALQKGLHSDDWTSILKL